MRITAIERRQDALDEKLSEVLAGTKAQTAAIDELKAMFVKCVGRFRETEDGSPLVSKSALENQVSQPSPLVQFADLGNDDVRDEMADEIDVQDSSPPRTATDLEKATPGSERTSEEGEKVEKADAEVTIATAKPRKEDSVVATAAGKATVTPSPAVAPPVVSAGMATRAVQKQAGKAAPPADQSVTQQVSPRKSNAATEKAAASKAPAPDLKGASGTSKGKTVAAGTEDSNPYSLKEAIDGLLEVGGAGVQNSPQKQKKPSKATTDDKAPTLGEDAPSKVRVKDALVLLKAPIPKANKLLVFNVHGTLLDCILLLDPNPNSAIRPSFRTAKRRVIFRPGLVDFLTRCFVHFEVAFWGTKSEANMDDVVPAMLGKLREGSTFKPAFVWSAKECEVTKFEDGIPIEWGKPLPKVFWRYPRFNYLNSVMIDHKVCRAGGNPTANLIIPTAFYVAEI
jgi:hypothetical protein